MMLMMMKMAPESSSSTGRFISVSLMGFILMLIMFLTLISTAESASVHQESKSRLLLQEVKTRRHHLAAVHGRSTADWNSISIPGGGGAKGSPPHVVCFQLQRIRHYCPPFPALAPPTPPSSSSPGDYEIDPRYGVEKRLVPSGPNPLHN
ncbi:OLC1v1032654C1 [Oldenlandia corymbosa var. corymbosa]|uniref:OLC1v1032654C1 n=1 Tax=Oldenlandia corymbosa var. corymbosa TaxID=529605 RepID=A0AAV1CPP1_OLDCO|nr:OLC1v1032654C1 [Oldenlandia corymbosa var. corymbosa]